MIHHIVAFRFENHVTAEAKAQLLAELAELPNRFPSMKRFVIGQNRSERDDRFTHAFSTEFDDLDTLNSYLASDEHEAFVRDRFRPSIADRAILSFNDDWG
jgi:2,3-dihydroxy-p-cumate/2,3-dihydroxybenzoate 3,4-dioxygenase